MLLCALFTCQHVCVGMCLETNVCACTCMGMVIYCLRDTCVAMMVNIKTNGKALGKYSSLSTG